MNTDQNQRVSWEQKVLTQLAFAALEEQKKTRFWKIFFRIIFGTLFFVMFFMMIAASVSNVDDLNKSKRHVSLVNLFGVIDSGGLANAESINNSLRKAFENKNSIGVILRIDSPGGSPVQSGMIYDEIFRLKAKYPDKPIYSVVEDTCASGAYYVAAATDKIFVNQASLVGSIGVKMGGFGYVDGMKMVGIERRLITAGENKGFRDPFSPQTEEHQKAAKSLVEEVHKQFIDAVKKGREGKLQDDTQVFSGMVWTGSQGIEMGLVDEIGSLDSVSRDIIKEENIVDYSRKPDFMENFSRKIGVAMAEKLYSSLFETSMD